MVIISTRAVEVSIHEVSPLSSLGLAASSAKALSASPAMMAATAAAIASNGSARRARKAASAGRSCVNRFNIPSLLDRFFVLFAGADAHGAGHLRDEDLAVADVLGARGLDDCLDDRFDQTVLDHHVDPDLGHEADFVFRAPVDLG